MILAAITLARVLSPTSLQIDTLMAWQLDQSYVRFKVVQAPTATEYVRHALPPAGCAVLAAFALFVLIVLLWSFRYAVYDTATIHPDDDSEVIG